MKRTPHIKYIAVINTRVYQRAIRELARTDNKILRRILSTFKRVDIGY